jgi:hydroxysqualene synthase
VSQRHQQENFPVASWLCPPRLRAPILAIYRFARAADDLADEGDAPPALRQAQLAQMRAQLLALPDTVPATPWGAALAAAVREFQLPLPLLAALLDAFEQDTWMQRYPDRAALLAYCERSANPIGRLLLHLAGLRDPAALAESDAVCSALQLINHWQDLGVDVKKPRLYLPLSDLARHGVDPEAVLAGRHSPQLAACVGELNDWALALMHQGRALPSKLGGRMGLELRAVMAGGRRVAAKISRLDHATLLQRPRLRAWDLPAIAARTLFPL